jgi:hypothetical protein
MKSHHPPANAERLPAGRPFVSEIPKFRKLVVDQGLVGLANNTKWDELITRMRWLQEHQWCPSFRYKCIDSETISSWDGEWQHHLPFPLISMSWIDLRFIEKVFVARLLPPKIVDHSEELEHFLSQIGCDFEKGSNSFRVYGYAPRDRSDFDAGKT